MRIFRKCLKIECWRLRLCSYFPNRHTLGFSIFSFFFLLWFGWLQVWRKHLHRSWNTGLQRPWKKVVYWIISGAINWGVSSVTPFSIACEIMKLFIRLPMAMSGQEGNYVNRADCPCEERDCHKQHEPRRGNCPASLSCFYSQSICLTHSSLGLNNIYKSSSDSCII